MDRQDVNQSEMIYEFLRARAGEPVSTTDLVQMFNDQDIEVKTATVSAILTGMPRGPRPGIIKMAKGVYAYRPGQASVVPERTGKGSIGSKIIAYFENGGGPISGTREIADSLGLSTKQAAQATGYLVKNDPRFKRIRAGVIEFNPTAIANVNGARVSTNVRAAHNEAFAPVTDSIPTAVWEQVGMNVVGKTKDGDLLAIDERGTAWAVTVAVTAKLV